MNWYKKAKQAEPETLLDLIQPEAATESTMSISPAQPISGPISEEVVITPRQIYTRDDVIQEREDLAPSRLRKKKKKRKKRKNELV